jgi:hypothetical protein
MSENKTLVKPEGVTDEEWEAADDEQKELLVDSPRRSNPPLLPQLPT